MYVRQVYVLARNIYMQCKWDHNNSDIPWSSFLDRGCKSNPFNSSLFSKSLNFATFCFKFILTSEYSVFKLS